MELQEKLFEATLKIPGANERRAFLTAECGGNASLCEQLIAMVENHEAADTFFDLPNFLAEFADLSQAELMPREKEGDRIGPYLLTAKIGSGGAGDVYAAEQENPVNRTVA